MDPRSAENHLRQHNERLKHLDQLASIEDPDKIRSFLDLLQEAERVIK